MRNCADSSVDWTLATLRIAGAAVVVPMMEELFWRSLVMRWIDQHDFLALAPARISHMALMISAVVFGLEHREFGAGIVGGLAYGYLYKRFSNLWAPVLAHAVTNGILGLSVLHTRKWQFWQIGTVFGRAAGFARIRASCGSDAPGIPFSSLLWRSQECHFRHPPMKEMFSTSSSATASPTTTTCFAFRQTPLLGNSSA